MGCPSFEATAWWPASHKGPQGKEALLALADEAGPQANSALPTKEQERKEGRKEEGVRGQLEEGAPLSVSRRGSLALSRGVSPYLLQMLTSAPLATRSWQQQGGKVRQGDSPYSQPNRPGVTARLGTGP